MIKRKLNNPRGNDQPTTAAVTPSAALPVQEPPFDVADFCTEMQACGLKLQLRLCQTYMVLVSPRDKITPTMRDLIQANKPAIVNYLCDGNRHSLQHRLDDAINMLDYLDMELMDIAVQAASHQKQLRFASGRLGNARSWLTQIQDSPVAIHRKFREDD